MTAIRKEERLLGIEGEIFDTEHTVLHIQIWVSKMFLRIVDILQKRKSGDKLILAPASLPNRY